MKQYFQKLKKLFPLALAVLVVFVLSTTMVRAGSGQVQKDKGMDFELASKNTGFSANQNAEFDFKISKDQNWLASVGQYFRSFFVDDYKNTDIQAEVENATGNGLTTEVLREKNGQFSVKAKSVGRQSKPGKYRVKVSVKDANITGGQEAVFYQDFSWGVLAFNSNKSAYLPNEKAYLQFAVLNESGHTVCDAELNVLITGPGRDIKLSTKDGTITRNAECGPDNIILNPDYYSYQELNGAGDYVVKVTAQNKNGVWEISDKLSVQTKIPFELERMGPTRINPKAPYGVKINIKANENYKGDLLEMIPLQFSISNYELRINDKIFTKNPKIEVTDVETKVIADNIDIKAGDNIVISYKFNAPEVTPEFYLLGSLQTKINGNLNPMESRQWQIASDGENQVIVAQNIPISAGNIDTVNWKDVAIASSTLFTGGKKYFVYVTAGFSSALAAANLDFQISYGSTTKYTGLIQASGDQANDAQQISWYDVMDQPATTTDISLQFRPNSSTAYAMNAQIIAINLSNLETTDWKYASNTTSRALSNVATIDATMTMDTADGVKDWLVFAGNEFSITNTTRQYISHIWDGTTAYMQETREGRNAAELLPHVLYRSFDNVATNTVFSIRNYASVAADTHLKSRVFALNLNRFESFKNYYANINTTMTPVGTWFSAGNLNAGGNYSPLTIGNQLIFAGLINDVNTQANEYNTRLLVNAVTSPVAWSWAQAPAGYLTPNEALEEIDSNIVTQISIPSSGQTISLDAVSAVGVNQILDEVSLTAFSTRLKNSNKPNGIIKTANFRTNGSGIIDYSIDVADRDLDDSRMKVEFATGTTCSFVTPGKATISTADADTTATYGDPKVDNLLAYQVGSSTGWITTTYGTTTVDFGWTSKSDIPSSEGSYCLRITVNDGTNDQASPATTTVFIDNSTPNISALTTANIKYKIGDTLRATATVPLESGNLVLGNGSTINGKPAINVQRVDDTTFTFDYTVVAGDTDRATGTIPYVISLIDAYNNKSATSSGNFANGTIDANPPAISSVTILNNMYGVGNTITATVTVTADADVYSLGASTINEVNAQNLKKINNTTYTVDYVVVSGNTDRATGTIPYSIILIDSFTNSNTAYAGNLTNASVDAHQPIVSSVYLTNGDYAIGDTLTAVITADSPNYTAGAITINGKNISNWVNNNNNTYNVDYMVAEGDTDRTANTIPISVVVLDNYGNSNIAYTVPAANTATLDAHTPSIASVSFAPSAGVLKVGATATTTITVAGAETAMTAGTIFTINGIDVSGSFTEIGGGQYRVTYTVSEGDNDILDASDLAINFNIKDSAGNQSVLFTTADASNRPGVDAHHPTIPGDLSFVVHGDNFITLAFGANSSDSNFKEYKIFYKAGTSGITESDKEFNQTNDINLANNLFNGHATTTIYGLLSATQYVFNIFAYDNAGNMSVAAIELSAITNYPPSDPNLLTQYKNDGVTELNNEDWTNNNSLKFIASSTDYESDPLIFYYEFLPSASSSLTATTVPVSTCASATSYQTCVSKVWEVIGGQMLGINSIPDSSTGYKWQVLACDEHACSDWTKYNSLTPNILIDTLDPGVPGNLTIFWDDATKAIFTLGSSSAEANFKEYKIFYKGGSSGVSELDFEHSSSTDINLSYKNYNNATSTLIENFSVLTEYTVNIWAYDWAGNKSHATEITFTTDNTYTPPTGLFNSVAEKTNGSGAIDISVEIDDPDDNNNLRLKIEYEAGADCVFATPLDPTLDANSANINADYGSPDVDNNSTYQVGSSTSYILTSFGSNTINFDWLSAVDLPDANGVYCLRMTANDGMFNQAISATTTVYIDNLAPTTPGDLNLETKNTHDLVLRYGIASVEDNFATYKLFYKPGADGVTEGDTLHSDINLSNRLYNNKATTTVVGLDPGNAYVFNIYAYDDYGNQSQATEHTFSTNFIPEAPSSLVQKKNNDTTVIANNNWTDENNIRLSSSIIDGDASEVLTAFFEFRPAGDSFLTATSVPANACSATDNFANCTSKVWAISSVAGDYSSSPFIAQVHPSAIPDSANGYQWQSIACDDNGVCSDWISLGVEPNFKVDTVSPTSPGDLSLNTRTHDSFTINFGSATVENNFKEYVIHYKVGTGGVTEGDTSFTSANDGNLLIKNYNGVATTTISGLNENTQYVLNIWAYDDSGQKSSATETSFTTNNRPTGQFVSATQKTDGSGKIDLSISVNDSNGENGMAKIDYVVGVDCNFLAPLYPTLDETDASATSTHGDAKILNSNVYQIGNDSGWIVTSSGANTVNFDWLSQDNLPTEDDAYCLRLTANDQQDDQATSATTTLIIDNKAPTIPGNLGLEGHTGSTLTLSFGAASLENHFAYYKIYYKEGLGTVNETDTELLDGDLNDRLFNETSTTSVSGLGYNTQYSFKIYAYDIYGNKSNSDQVTFTTNAPPTGFINSIAQKTDDSGTVDISIEVYDANNDDCTAKLEYVSGALCNFASPLDPSLSETQSDISSDHGTPTITNSSAYQIGSPTKIITNQGSNTINFDWLAASDIGSMEGAYCLRLTVNDTNDDQLVQATSSFFYDNKNPTTPGSLNIASVSAISVDTNFGTPGFDTNFSEYKIFYKVGTTGVTENDLEFNRNDDPALGNENFNFRAFATIDHLNQNANYVFNIWMYDDYGNKTKATNEVSTTTTAIASATWRESEDTPDPTNINYLTRQENIRLRLDIANTRDYKADANIFDLQYAIKTGSCSSIFDWTTVPVTSSSEHFNFVSSGYVSDASSTTERLSNSGAYEFTPGYVVANPSSKGASINIAANQHTEMEFVFRPSIHAQADTTYCFRSTNDGVPLDYYRQYAIFTMAPPPIGSFESAELRSDASSIADISFKVFDVNGGDARAKLEYVASSTCNFSSALEPTLDATDENITATYGDPEIDNAYPYQIGTTTGWIITDYGTSTVNVDWLAGSNLTGADGTYCLRLTLNDGYDDQAIPATTTIVIDQVNPTVPGDLVDFDIYSNTVTLSLGTSSSDTNFNEYKIFYKEGASGVTESDTLWGSSSDPNLGFADYDGATSTTITGLTINKQYVFRIWAYDRFGNKSVSGGEVSVIIRYKSRSENWRWYNDQDLETPTATLAPENVSPIDVADGAKIKLRLALREIRHITGENIKIRLQYSTFSDFSSDLHFVGEIGSSTELWNYADGIDDDNAAISQALLNGVVIGATHNESGIASTSYAHTTGSIAEWEFTIRNNSAQVGTSYYFRAYDNTNLSPIMKNGVSTYPSLLVASPNLSYVVSGLAENEAVEGLHTTISTTPNSIDFGSLIPGHDEIAAQRFTIDTNAGGGYQLFVYQRQKLLSDNGADINPVPYPNATPNAWPINPSPSAFGYHAGDDTLSGASPSRFSADNTYAGFDSDFEEISYSSIPVANETVDMVIRLESSNMQEAGDYATEIVYVLLPTFFE